MSRKLTKKEKAIIQAVIANRIRYLDRLLEDNIEEILSEVDELRLTDEDKREEALLLAKEISFRG